MIDNNVKLIYSFLLKKDTKMIVDEIEEINQLDSNAATDSAEVKKSTKRSPWAKKVFENPYATPASRCINFKQEFNIYVDETYQHLDESQRAVLWKTVANQMLTEPFSKFKEIIDNSVQSL